MPQLISTRVLLRRGVVDHSQINTTEPVSGGRSTVPRGITINPQRAASEGCVRPCTVNSVTAIDSKPWLKKKRRRRRRRRRRRPWAAAVVVTTTTTVHRCRSKKEEKKERYDSLCSEAYHCDMMEEEEEEERQRQRERKGEVTLPLPLPLSSRQQTAVGYPSALLSSVYIYPT
jgi:hypothetical protein